MKMAQSSEEQRQWMEQWRSASVALREVKKSELRALTEQEALQQFNALDLPAEAVYISPNRSHGQGLVEQQRLFSKLRCC
jgi:hypothetical protein